MAAMNVLRDNVVEVVEVVEIVEMVSGLGCFHVIRGWSWWWWGWGS